MYKTVIAGIVMLCGSFAVADLVTCTALTSDRSYRSNGTVQGGATDVNLYAGVQASGIDVGFVIPFLVPDLNGKAVTGATFSLTVVGNALTSVNPGIYLEIYGIRYSQSSSTTATEDYTGTTTPLVGNWLSLDANTATGTYTAGSEALTAWIAGQVGTTGGGYLFLTVRPSAAPDETYKYLTVASADASANVPTLTLTMIP